MSKPASWVKDARKRTQNKGIEKGFQRRRVEQSGLDHIWTADLGGPYFTSNQSKATTEKRDVDETIAIDKYPELLPHQDKMITMATYIPQEINEKLLHDMKSLSSQIKKIANSQVPHNLWDIRAPQGARAYP